MSQTASKIITFSLPYPMQMIEWDDGFVIKDPEYIEDAGEKKMNNLSLVKSENFHGAQCDFWHNADNDGYFMTAEQLGNALGYSAPRVAIGKLVTRHPYLNDTEFSGVTKMVTPGGPQETRIFTEDGIYEVTMLSKTERAREFRAKVRQVLKELRKGTIKAVRTPDNRILEVKIKNAEARLLNARRKDAEFVLKEVDRRMGVLSAQAVELLTINALEIVTGKNSIPRQQTDKHYTAEDIATDYENGGKARGFK